MLLLIVSFLLLLLPLGVSLDLFGGGPDPVVVGFLPFQSPPGEEELERTAIAVMEGVHGRFRDNAGSHLSLVGPSVTQRFRDSGRMPQELGRRIAADVVVIGGLRPGSENTALLSVALIRVEDGRSLWTEEIELRTPTSPAGREELIQWLVSRLRRALQATRVPS
ncbi:MAG: hypothetical protein ACOC8K_07995 [Gemmatimonadota bacterium]